MAKPENYTPEMVEVMKGMYLGVLDEPQERRDEVVAEIAVIFGKKERSVRAKLSREGIYIAKVPVGKDGKPAVKKDALAVDLARAAGVVLTSAESLTKPDLEKLIAAFAARDAEIAFLSREVEAADFEPAEFDENGDTA